MNKKIVNLGKAKAKARGWRKSGKRVVLTNGCFDVFHPGHIHYLERAKSLGNKLIVGLNGNASVRSLKGAHRPIHSERARAKVLAGLTCVDLVVIFPQKRATRLIEASAPNIYVKGGDYEEATLNLAERAALRKIGTRIKFIPFEPGFSTSLILGKLRKRGR